MRILARPSRLIACAAAVVTAVWGFGLMSPLTASAAPAV